MLVEARPAAGAAGRECDYKLQPLLFPICCHALTSTSAPSCTILRVARKGAKEATVGITGALEAHSPNLRSAASPHCGYANCLDHRSFLSQIASHPNSRAPLATLPRKSLTSKRIQVVAAAFCTARWRWAWGCLPQSLHTTLVSILALPLNGRWTGHESLI